jgi:hypothetical protein
MPALAENHPVLRRQTRLPQQFRMNHNPPIGTTSGTFFKGSQKSSLSVIVLRGVMARINFPSSVNL